MDDDGIPELVEDCFDYWVNVYSYSNGQVYTVADEWGYSLGRNLMYLPYQGMVCYAGHEPIDKNFQYYWELYSFL